MATPLSIVLSARDITRDELAARADTSRSWLTQLVAGRAHPSSALAQRIADVLEVDVDDLWGDSDVDVVVSFVRRTTQASGVSEQVSDAAAATKVARLLGEAS